ncbi:MAG: Tex family protein [Candidatus Neomarinimicrobiota bacterium]
MNEISNLLIQKTGLSVAVVQNVLQLLEDGATIPFIARYRKEMTGGATDEQLRDFAENYQYVRKLLERRADILRLIEERGHLDPKIQEQLLKAATLTELEDVYRPYREKKSTRAGVAIANGLEPLADLLAGGRLSLVDFRERARAFVKGPVDSVAAAVRGAQDILAERYSDDPRERELIRGQAQRNGLLEVKAGRQFDPDGVYANFREHAERLAGVPSHRYLAIDRGVNEKQLSVRVAWEIERIQENIRRYKLPRSAADSVELLYDAYCDGLKRLLLPSVERELLAELKQQSDRRAIAVFGKNLTQLLLTPPVVGMTILGVDPGFRSGCKLAVIDESGKFLAWDVIYPTPPRSQFAESQRQVLALVEKFAVNAVAIGNGTASRETQEFFARLNRESAAGLKYTVVSEAGASVYSASRLGQEEYPDLDVTVRGAISIAQRLLDPLAALVKIEPKALGIGQYQHAVDQKLLARRLHETVENLVNRVGVEVNRASAALLAYVAGVGPKLAAGIIAYRDQNGAFSTKRDLLKVPGLGARAFEQCAGFLRIRNGASLLDNTGVHPESYRAAARLLKDYDIKTLEPTAALAADLDLGTETLQDIIRELKKPGFDPRTELPEIPFRDDITDIRQLKPGSLVAGVVRNIVDFGAFVDIGLKNDGLIHISQLSDRRVGHPLEVLAVNQYLPRIRVVTVDAEKGWVGLSLKETD